jgi:hypothetical protein
VTSKTVLTHKKSPFHIFFFSFPRFLFWEKFNWGGNKGIRLVYMEKVKNFFRLRRNKGGGQLAGYRQSADPPSAYFGGGWWSAPPMISIDFRPAAGGKFFWNIGENTESSGPNDFDSMCHKDFA